MKITLAKALKAANYSVQEGTEYLWDCFGPSAYIIDCGNFRGFGIQSYWTLTIVFNRYTQLVYEAHLCNDPGHTSIKKYKAWRWINPKYLDVYKNEHKRRGVSFKYMDEDDKIKYIDVDAEKMLLIIEKVVAKHNKKRF